MIPTKGRILHNPDKNQYGDCLRACVASILDIDQADDVPHFYENGDDGKGIERLQQFLGTKGFDAFVLSFEANAIDDFLCQMKTCNFHYILTGFTTDNTSHCVVACGDKIVNDPSWFPKNIVRPTSPGLWTFIVFVKK